MEVSLEVVRANVRKADTEDLLDRATVYREGMEVEALDIIEEELRRRGVGRDEIAAHELRRREAVLPGAGGVAVKCSRCPRPAVTWAWGWHRLWGVLPLFPRRLACCAEHRPGAK